MEADMSESMEKDRKGERFSLIEPPMLPDEPIKPNRIAIALLSFVLALAAGFGYAFLKESLSKTIYGSEALMAITGAPPLVIVPYISTEMELTQSKQFKRNFFLIIVAGFITILLLIHFFVRPLDVLWYVLLRKFA